MKVRIEVDEDNEEDCIIIHCKTLDERILKIQEILSECNETYKIILLYKLEKAYYFPLDKILFFETENKEIRAHTQNEIYKTEYKLYELEELLPGYFMRISKSTIINLNYIYSISKNITSSSMIEFAECRKQVYVSRNYYKALIERLEEKRRRL